MEPLRRVPAVIAVLAVGLLLSVVLRGVARTSSGMRSVAEFRAWEMGGICVGFGALAVAGALLLPGAPSARLGLRRGRLPAHAVIALAIGLLAFSHAVDAGLALWEWLQQGSLPQRVIARLPGEAGLTRGWALAGVLLGMALAPGVGEELLYRGLVQRSVAPWAGARGAVLFSALAFGAVHGQPAHVASAALLGLYLGTVAQWAGSIRPAIVCHTLNNGVVALAATGAIAGSRYPQITAPASLLIGALCLLWAHHFVPSGNPAPGSGEPPLQPGAQSVDA